MNRDRATGQRALVVRARTIARAAAGGMLATLLGLILAGCGGSSSGGAVSGQAARAASAGAGFAGDRGAAMRSCLEKQGVKLPSAPSGGAPPGGIGASGKSASPPSGGAQMPGGAAQSKLWEAMKKCGGGLRPAGGIGGAASKAALEKFASCMRENGVKLPAPSTAGSGPVFDTKGIDTAGSIFKSAQSKCRGYLPAAFAGGAPAGAPPSGASGANGTPPSAQPGAVSPGSETTPGG